MAKLDAMAKARPMYLRGMVSASSALKARWTHRHCVANASYAEQIANVLLV